MDCSLWFGRCRINNASEITEHFDMAALRGYFLGGSLAEWLREHGGEEQAERLETIDPSDPELDLRLAQVFGVTAAFSDFPLGAVFFTCGLASVALFPFLREFSLRSCTSTAPSGSLM